MRRPDFDPDDWRKVIVGVRLIQIALLAAFMGPILVIVVGVILALVVPTDWLGAVLSGLVGLWLAAMVAPTFAGLCCCAAAPAESRAGPKATAAAVLFATAATLIFISLAFVVQAWGNLFWGWAVLSPELAFLVQIVPLVLYINVALASIMWAWWQWDVARWFNDRLLIDSARGYLVCCTVWWGSLFVLWLLGLSHTLAALLAATVALVFHSNGAIVIFVWQLGMLNDLHDALTDETGFNDAPPSAAQPASRQT